MKTASSDRIEKHVTLKAPIARVWAALTDAKEFSQWFGIELDGPFVVGRSVRGVFPGGGAVPDEMKKAIEAEEKRLGLAHAPVAMPPKDAVFCIVDRIEPQHTFAFRWIPYGIDASIDWQSESEPMTRVEFTLEPLGPQETRLRIVESGFDKVPAHRRARAFKMNEGGWAAQSENIARYVEGRAHV